MNFAIKDITKENWILAIKLKVKDDQVDFVATNAMSIAQSKFDTFIECYGIYVDEEMVGFTAIGLNPEDATSWIVRYMIDEKHQGKGYGKKGLKALIKFMKEKYETDSIFLDVVKNNVIATNLYVNAGFKDTGKRHGESPVYKLDLSTSVENY